MASIRVRGRPVAYDERGTANPGVPMLLLHGFTGSKEDFAAVVPRLGSERRVVAVDLPGHGGSAGPDDPAAYSLDALAAWTLGVADALDLGGFHLLGHSLGGLVAQRVAARASQRLTSLVLADTGLGRPRDEAAAAATAIAEAVRRDGLDAAWRVSQEINRLRGLPPEPDPARAAFVRERFLALAPAAVLGEVRALLTAEPTRAFLRGIDVPVLVLHGACDDVWTPADQRLLARTIRGARHVVIPASRHSPQLENPDAWLAAVRDFLHHAERPSG